jgi:hypothetical protein
VKWIEDYVERKTAGARKQVEDAEALLQQGQENILYVEIVGLRSREPERRFEEMEAACGDSLSDLANSDDGEDVKDENYAETEQGKLSEHDEPGWVMGTITKTVPQRIETVWEKQMRLYELTQLGWEGAAMYIHR